MSQSAPPAAGVPRKARVESIDAFRGFTIFAMIFVIQVAGYRLLPQTFPHFGSAPVSTWKHASEDNDPHEWAFYENGTTTTESTRYRHATVAGREADGRYTVTLVDEKGTTQTFPGVAIPFARPLRAGEDVIAIRNAPEPAAGATRWKGDGVSFTGVGNGCTLTDLVAPFFVFIVGMCLPLSKKGRGPGWWTHALARTGALILAGVIYISLILKLSWWWGILQAIGISYLMGALAMQLPVAGRWALVAAVAAFHAWASLHIPWWVHVGEPGAKFFTVANLGGDKLAPLNVHCTPWASISYGLITVVGTLLGEAVASRDRRRIITQSLVLGLAFSLAGYAMHLFQAPMNKDYVSSSYALFTAGQGALWFLAFYLVIDVAGFKAWAWPLNVFGANALLAYFLQPIVRMTFEKFGLMPFFHSKAGWDGMMWGLIWTMCLWAVVLFCNKRNIYWKL